MPEDALFPPPDPEYDDEELNNYQVIKLHYERLSSQLSAKSRATWFSCMPCIKKTARNTKGPSWHRLGVNIRKRGCWISWLIIQDVYSWKRLGTYADHIISHWDVANGEAFGVDWPLDSMSLDARAQMPIKKTDRDEGDMEHKAKPDMATRREAEALVLKNRTCFKPRSAIAEGLKMPAKRPRASSNVSEVRIQDQIERYMTTKPETEGLVFENGVCSEPRPAIAEEFKAPSKRLRVSDPGDTRGKSLSWCNKYAVSSNGRGGESPKVMNVKELNLRLRALELQKAQGSKPPEDSRFISEDDRNDVLGDYCIMTRRDVERIGETVSKIAKELSDFKKGRKQDDKTIWDAIHYFSGSLDRLELSMQAQRGDIAALKRNKR
ncbi:hypothetical protein CDD81_1227 [Ophiocordyceps australis]|uniref:Uncharacterized protein n=1 Tax=Ophiocordyceps australis TaxID=1399860 RepID=A0A2C5XKQ2_9HYPO|nr:hypothetical protein CDD81_1227 [Ophiocordyceps australis]